LVLGTTHRADEARVAQHAIPTGLAIEKPLFGLPLKKKESFGKGSTLEGPFEYIIY
jgi:hypothetical protein